MAFTCKLAYLFHAYGESTAVEMVASKAAMILHSFML